MFWDKFLKLCESVDKAPNTVATEIGIASGTLTNWKNGGMPRWKAIDKICDYFHVTRDYFFPPDQKEKPTQADRADYMTQLFRKLSDKNKDILIEVMTKMLEGENSND